MSGPIRVRTSRPTGWPTASHMRRTCRLRPSWMTIRSTPGPTTPTGAGAVRPVVELDPLAQPPHAPAVRHALHLGQVLLLHPEGGMGQALGQLAVVGEDQQPLAVGVEPAHREHPGLGGTSATTVGRPWGSSAVVTTPAGLLSR